MIQNDRELHVTLDRISKLQDQIALIRETETNPQNYHSSASGFLAELDRMNLEVREYLWSHPVEIAAHE